MNDFEDQSLPPELGEIAKQLRDNRHEASALELDKAKQRVMRRVSAPRRSSARLGWLHKPTGVLTAAILAMTIGGGTAVALVSHHSASHRIHTHRIDVGSSGGSPVVGGVTPKPNAAQVQYGTPTEIFVQDLFNLTGAFLSNPTSPGAFNTYISGVFSALLVYLGSLGL